MCIRPGYNGTKLGQACGTVAYQQVVSTYGLHAFDFDLEEPEIENTAAINNELAAAQILQRNNPGLFISITMPSIATGANYFGQQLMNEAKILGFTVHVLVGQPRPAVQPAGQQRLAVERVQQRAAEPLGLHGAC